MLGQTPSPLLPHPLWTPNPHQLAAIGNSQFGCQRRPEILLACRERVRNFHQMRQCSKCSNLNGELESFIPPPPPTWPGFM